MLIPARKVIVVLLLLTAFTLPSKANAEQNYEGQTLSYWLKAIRDRNEELMPLAFDAIRSLGPDARASVPELVRIVAAPFTPIRLGVDSDEVIADKLYDLELRSEAIDALAYIGEAAAPATIALIDWALTTRIVPPEKSSIEENDRFIDLVTLEAEYRIGVIHAIRQFRDPAIAILTRSLQSAEAEKRKFEIMTLGGNALAIAAELLRSRNCDDARLGIAILEDLGPVVANVYLTELRHMAMCYAN